MSGKTITRTGLLVAGGILLGFPIVVGAIITMALTMS